MKKRVDFSLGGKGNVRKKRAREGRSPLLKASGKNSP